MALTQLSLSGGRVTGSNRVAYTLVGTGAAQSDAPSLGDNITSYTGGAGQPATPSTTGTTSLLCVESRSVPHPAFKGQWAVTAVFSALRTVSISGLALPSDWFVIEISPGIQGNVWRGTGKTVVLDVPNTVDNKTVEATFPYYTVYPGESGIFAPQVERYRIRGASRPTRNEVTLYYDPPTWWRVLERHPGRGFLSCDIVDSIVRPLEDADGNAVWKVEYGATNDEVFFHVPVKGTGLKAENLWRYRLEFASDIGWMNTLAALKHTTNSQAMPNLGGAAAGTLRIVGAHGERSLTTESLNRYRLVIESNPDGWNEETEIQKYQPILAKTQVRDENNDPISGRYRDKSQWHKIGDPYKVTMYPPANWSVLDKLLE